MSFLQTFSLWVRIVLQRIQSKLSFDGWSAYPQFSTDKVHERRTRCGLVCVRLRVLYDTPSCLSLCLCLILLGSRSRGHTGMYFGHSFGNTCTGDA